MSDPTPEPTLFDDPQGIVIESTHVTPTPEEVQSIVRGIIARGSHPDITAVPIIKGNQNFPPPPRVLYGVVTLIGDSSPQIIRTRRLYSAVEEDDTLIEIDEWRRTLDTFDVQWVRAGALQAAKRCRLWLRDPIGTMWGRDRGIEIIRIGQIRNLEELFRKRWEERAGFDIRIQYNEHVVARIPRIQIAEGGMEVSVSSGGHVETLPINADVTTP